MSKKQLYLFMLIVFLTATGNSYAFISGTISGIVRSSASQKPIESAILKTSAGRTSMTVANGAYHIEHEEGQYTLTVLADGYESYSKLVHIQINNNTELYILLIPKAINMIPPVISSVSPELILDGENSASIQAFDITSTAGIEKVEGIVIIPENPQMKVHTPICDLPVLPFHIIAGTNNYSATYNSFITIGHYQIVIKATNILGNTSLPLTASVIQTTGPDVFEPDDSMTQAKAVVINAREARRHTFFDPGDEDWIKFYGIVGKVYRIEISHLERKSLPEIDFYGPGNTFLFTEPLYDFVIDGESYMEWIVDAEGIYYVCVKNKDPELFGANTGYDLRVGYPEGPIQGTILVKITDINSNPLNDIIIKTSNGMTGFSNSFGLFDFDHEIGTYDIKFDSFFYENATCSIKILELKTTHCDVQMEKRKFQLSDAIKALQRLSGVDSHSDFQANISIGLNHVIYILNAPVND
jgi:hypothetical protein